MKLRRWSTVTLAAVALLTAAGCATTPTSSEPDSPSATAGTTASPTNAPTSTFPPSTPSADAGRRATAAASDGLCSASMLSGAVQEKMGGAAAGSAYRQLVLTNTSAAPCVIEGFPGVSYVGANGKQIGAPAERDLQNSAVAVKLQPGASATAALRQIDARNFGDACDAQPATGVRVYPPSATDWLVAEQAGTACANPGLITMTIGAFQAR